MQTVIFFVRTYSVRYSTLYRGEKSENEKNAEGVPLSVVSVVLLTGHKLHIKAR